MAEQSTRARLDVLLVERGLCATRARARDAIKRGQVTVARNQIRKAGQLVETSVELAIAEDANPYVSRGGLKLAHALDTFAVDPAGKVCIDVGASTGGFTEVLLQRGAGRVYAIDVGHGQLHETLRDDERVVSLEKLNARDISTAEIPQTLDLIVCDVSFMSLKLALPATFSLSRSGTVLVALIKPQFEVGRERLGKGGIVRDPALHERVCGEISDWIAALDWRVTGIEPSPVEGPDGNREFLLAAECL